jgi:hypothetical protein
MNKAIKQELFCWTLGMGIGTIAGSFVANNLHHFWLESASIWVLGVVILLAINEVFKPKRY